MNMSRRERRKKGLLLWQLVGRVARLQKDGADIEKMSNEELATAILADMVEDGLVSAVDWEKLKEILIEILEQYGPLIIQLIISLL